CPCGGGTGALGSVPDDPYIARKKVHELMWAQKIRDQLEYIPGVVVSTNVELTLDTEFDEQRTVLDQKGVVYQSRESGSSKTTEATGPAGRPGVVANQAGGANQPGAVGAGGGSSMSEETSQVETQTAVPTTIVHRKQQGLTPERVKVAVAIPTNYYTKVWSDRNPTPAGQDPPPADPVALAEIERQVKE